jgi:aspartokinase
LFLADEIKDYRKGLSQIHKNPDEVGSQSKKKRTDCVFKFGGSSLANAERIDHVARLIKDQIELGYRPRAVVCSAMGKTTNNLLSAGEFALGEYKMQNGKNNIMKKTIQIIYLKYIFSHLTYAIPIPTF